jgi:hypothetical protein
LKEDRKEERYRFSEETGRVVIYQAEKVRIEEILPLLIKPKRARKHF